MAVNKSNYSTTDVKVPLNAQVLITGISVSPETSGLIAEFTKNHIITFWCHPDGTMGHLDSVKGSPSMNQISTEFHDVANKFPYLELAITIMSGSTGTWNQPLVTYSLNHGKFRIDNSGMAHFGHPAPKRSPLLKKPLDVKKKSA